MASAFCCRALLLLQLLQLCLGQYSYNYYNYDYGDYGNSWCPFGVNGLCVCENDIVDCTGQGLPSIPLDLPATTKQLNLANNPWTCDCNLKWLSIWMLTTAADNNVQFVDAASTNCVEWPSVSMLSLLPASFLPCAAPVRTLRSVAHTRPKPIHTFPNWNSVCSFWFNATDCSQGPSEAGACVLSVDTLDVSVVQFSTFTTQTDALTCRDYCFSLNSSYHAFENTTFHCLCGESLGSNTCSDCNSATLSSTVVTMCQFMRVPDVSHILSDVAVTFTSPIITHSPVTFTVSGVPSLVTSLSWTFGDGAQQSNNSAVTVSHTYLYAGSFLVRVELCGLGVCRMVQVRVWVDTQNVQTTLTCPSVSEVEEKIDLNVSLSNVYSSTVKWTRSSSTGGTVPVGGCSSGWTAFSGRCIKSLSRSKGLSQAESSCNSKGGTLLRLNSLEEEQQIPSLLSLSASSTAWVGARYNGSVYKWEATSEAAYFLRALSIDRSSGDCLVMTFTGLVAADCSSQHPFLCQQEAEPCPLGQQLASSGLCYYVETTASSWEQARKMCQGYNNGDLATLTDQTISTDVITSLNIASATWIGLTAPNLLGHYTWVDGVWFAQDGLLLEINFNVEARSDSNIVGIQVLRPTCPSSKVVIRPGCQQKAFTHCGNAADASSCPSLPACSIESEHPCPLTSTCISSSTVCSCASSTVSTNIDCSNTTPDSELKYTMIGEAVYEIPAAGGSFVARVQDRIEVQANDILALQSKNSDFGFCEVDPYSPWQQVGFIRVGDKWATVNKELSLSYYTEQKNYVCKVNAVYGSPKLVAVPDILAYAPDSGTYSFSVEVEGSAGMPDSCNVEVVQEVGDLMWLYPALITVSGSSVVYVEAGVKQYLVAMVTKGSLLQMVWEASSGVSRNGAWVAACPGVVPAGVAECHNTTSELANPFMVFDDTFSTSTSVSLTLNVSNSLGWKSETVVVYAVDPIHNLALTHSGCLSTTTCFPLVEVGVIQKFQTTKSSGSVDLYEFQKNGTVIQSGRKASLSHTFSMPGVYEISVNASNGLNSMTASMQVTAKVRAQLAGVVLGPTSPMIVRDGSDLTVTLNMSVAQSAEVTVTWDFGDGHSNSSVEQAAGEALSLQKTHAYTAPGSYILKVTLLDAFGEEVNVTSQVNVLSVIGSLTTLVSPTTIAAGNSTAVTVSVGSGSNSPNFGTISYTFDFQDGHVNKHNSTNNSKTVHHVFHTSGTYNVTITVSNQVSSRSTTTDIIVHVCPTAVNLTYDGPKNVSEQLTFTALVDQGSDLKYEFDFGDGSSISKLYNGVVVHTYSTPNSYNASVTVRNAVCSVSDIQTVIVMNANTLVVGMISHDSYVAINQSVKAAVDVVTLDLQKVSLVWMAQNTKSSKYVYNLTLRGFTSIQFTFSEAVPYRISVTVKLDNGPSRVASSTIIVQEPVTNVTLTAPDLVSMVHSQPTMVTFLANSPDGTDIDFRWYNNGALLSSQGPNITVAMSTAGLSNISVVAFNEVSQVGTWSLVDVQHTIENVTLACLTCINTKFVATNTLSQFNCTFVGSSATVVWTVGTTQNKGTLFQHTFSVTGLQSIQVTVSNRVSSQNATFDVVIEEAVSALTLTADKPVTSEGSSVRLTADHSQGTDVIYTWQCGFQPPYNTSSPTTHIAFTSWGLHNCSVVAANNVSSQQATLDIQVLENITSLGVKNLTAGSMLYIPINRSAGVEVECNTYFKVNFTWSVMKAGAVIRTENGPLLTYTFTTPDYYNLTLVAINAISSLTVNIRVEALEEISNLRLTSNDTTVLVGDGVQLTATTDSGSYPKFEWFVDGVLQQNVSGWQSFPISFNSAGSYVIEVSATNPLSSLSANFSILVQYPVQNIHLNTSLDMGHPFVSQYSTLTFQSSISQGSDPVFHWTVDSPSSKQTHIGRTLKQIFSETGDYSILLVVSNTVSQENRTFEVHVEKAITSLNLSVSPSTAVATGTQLSFVGTSNSDAFPVSYDWTIHGQNYTGSSQSQSFSAPGFYSIKLLAFNNISLLEEKETIEVQDPVTGLQMSDCNMTRQVAVTSTLSATAQGTNISFSWIVQLPTQNRTSLGPTLTLVFPTAGSYPVHVLAGNKVRQETLTCTVLVQEPVANVAVHVDDPTIDYIFTNQNVTFRITGDYLTDAVYTWDFVGLHMDTTNTSTYLKTFTVAQPVTLVVTVANDISMSQVSVNFTVQDLRCNLPVVTPVGSDSRTTLRSKTTQFDVYIDNKGCSEYVVTHTWKIYDAKDCTQALSTSSLSLSSVEMNTPTLILPAAVLPATKQYFCVHYTLGYQKTPVAEEVFYNLTVEATPLVAIISGGGWQQLEVVIATPPLLSVGVECVSCEATGDYRISSSHHGALAASCESCGPVTYTWTVMRDGVTPVSVGAGDTSTGTTAPNLVILRNTLLQDSSYYTFTVTVDSVDGSRSQGKASITLSPNQPPSGGTCTATPDSIVALQEFVTVSCQGWQDSDDPGSQLMYEIKTVTKQEVHDVLRQIAPNTCEFDPIPTPLLVESSSAQLLVTVLDEYGARTEALQKTISFTTTTRPPGVSVSQALYLAANTTLTMLMQQGDPVPLLQYSLALTLSLNSASMGALTPADLTTQAMVRAAITLCVSSNVTVETMQQAQQMAFLLQQLTAYSAEYQVSGCQTLILQSLETITNVLQRSVRAGLDRDDFAFPNLYTTVYNLMEALSSSSSSSSTSSSTTSLADYFPQFASISSTSWGTSTRTLDFSTAAVSTVHTQDAVTTAFSVAETVTSTVLQAVVLDEEGISYQVGGMEVDGQRTLVGMLGSYLEQGSCRFHLPSGMFPGVSSTDEILKIMIMLDPNPFTWGYIDEHVVDTRVPTLSFKYADGTDLPVRDLSSTIEILMFDSDGNSYTVTNSSLLQNPHYNPLAKTTFDTWTLEKGLSKKLEVDAQVGTSQVSALHVMVRVEALPNQTDLQSGTVPTAAIKAYLGAGFEASADSYTAYKEITTALMASGVDHRLYTFFVAPKQFSDSTEYSITLVNEDMDHDVNISSTFYLSSCQYYDESNRVWSAAGCSVSEESIPLATVCHCNHLTAFGGSSLLPISSIQFSDLAALELGLNPVTLIAVCTILALYIVGVIVCRHLDRADLRRISLVPLCGRDGVFKYHITVITGRQIGAGTSAHIGIKLYGDHGKSEARHLTKRSAFQRNSRDTFLIATDNDLGTLHKVCVWHDNTGSSPAWYLTQVQVQDFQSGERYIFPANTWLSLEQEDGTLKTELRVADHEELHSFSRVFQSALANSMAERHMWISVFNRPDHSRFTRVQRITCCVTLVYLYMFLNAMWYGLIKDQSDKTDSISWAVIGWEEVLIALVSMGCIFPLALVLICIFKRSRSKADVFMQAMRPQSAQTLEIDAMCDVSQYGGSLRTMTPNEDWTTILERESTTESIPSPRTPRTPRTPRSPRNSPEEVTAQLVQREREETGLRLANNMHDRQSEMHNKDPEIHFSIGKLLKRKLWNQENILKSWPEKLPSFAEEEKEKEKPTGKPAASKPASGGTSTADDSVPVASTSGSAAKARSAGNSISGTAATKISKSMSMTTKTSAASSLKKTNSMPGKASGQFVKGSKAATQPPPRPPPPVTTRKTASFKTDTENDSDDHEEFLQKLDQIDRELKKSSSIRSRASLKSSLPRGLVKKHSSHSSQSAIEDLFESDDEWVSEGIEGGGPRGGRRAEGAAATFNPRQDPSLDRRASVTSLKKLRMASMHMPGSAGSSLLRRDSTFMRRDSTFNSFLMSEKSRTTLSTLLKNRMQLLGNPSEDRGCRLPWFCVYVGYGICLALSLVSILMVLLYGYNFGPAIALQWLLSVLLAFLCSVLVLEPLKVVVLALYVALVVRDAEKDVEADSIDVMPSIEANEQLKEVKFRPLGGFALLQAHKEGRKKIRLHNMIRQTLAYLLLTATVLAVANVYFGPDLFRATGHLENSVVFTGSVSSSSSSGSVNFYNISSTDEFWDWARGVWVPALYRPSLVPSEENPVLLGPARLRQVRSTTVDCLTTKVQETRSCVGRLEFTEDTATYSPGWLSTGTNASWVHSSADHLDTMSKFGQDMLYSGGGYVQELGTSYNLTLHLLQQLDNDKWLDRRSRALFLEWTSYSAGEDLFLAVTLLLEFPISGGVLASHNIQTQRLYIFNPDRVEPLYVCQVLMLLPAIYLLIHTILTLKEQRSQFVRSPGNWLELAIALLCLASVGLYVGCVVTATDTLDRFSSGSSASFTNFEHAVHLHAVLRVLHACLLFLLFLKIAGQVRFIRRLSVYPRTLAAASSRLFGATFIFFLLLLTYTQLGYLFYGSALHGYRSFQNALMSMFGVMKGSVHLTSELEHQQVFTHFFFYSFYAFVYGLFVALVIAILQDAYKMTCSQMFFKSSLEPQDYEMIEFILKRFKLWAGITKPKPAFRRVQFEGQPSLPSRGSSSAASSRRSSSQNSMEGSTPTPDLITSAGSGDALDRLLPAWEKMLSLLGTVEGLDKEEQRQVGRVQIACNRMSSKQGRKAGAKKDPQGKPPVNPKSKLSRFRLNFQNSHKDQSSEVGGARQVFTPPPTSSRDVEGPSNIMMRTFSDQGARSFGLPERPASESQKVRPSAPGSQAGVKDTFPGSASQRSQPSGSNARTRAGVSAGSSAGQKGAVSSASTSGTVRRGPGIPAKGSASQSAAADNSKKKAWEG
ncbi:polycystin-1-like [Babylonia areolata]|uniref:polycystin-1-like n=1 Tax=Babylonia areolata TaxID=304850 RepID=UPI003FCFFD55